MRGGVPRAVSTDIVLPQVSPDDAAVTLVKWHVGVGSRVAPGDVLAEIESDKAIVELEAEQAGVITEIRVAEGSDDVRADQVIAVIDAGGSTAGAPDSDDVTEGTPTKDATHRANETPGPATAGAPQRASETPDETPPARASAHLHAGNNAPPGSDIAAANASPLAARMADKAGIDLERVAGSGPDGRVLADDVRAAVGPVPSVLSVRRETPAPVDGDTDYHGGFAPEFDVQTPDNMRRIIAERLVQSKRDAPHFYMSADCRAGALMDFKRALEESSANVSLNDLILKITAATLTRVPALNAAWSDAGIRQFRGVDIAVAVAIEGGLITPVVREAERKRITEIAAEMRDLVERARAGQLAREEYQGGTFTVSNMGMYGVDRFTAVINPPQAAILAVGAVREQPVAENGVIGSAEMMTLSLSVDHRVSDGVAAAEFLRTFKRLAADPRLLLL